MLGAVAFGSLWRRGPRKLGKAEAGPSLDEADGASKVVGRGRRLDGARRLDRDGARTYPRSTRRTDAAPDGCRVPSPADALHLSRRFSEVAASRC
jgi:hypothetical protein